LNKINKIKLSNREWKFLVYDNFLNNMLNRPRSPERNGQGWRRLDR